MVYLEWNDPIGQVKIDYLIHGAPKGAHDIWVHLSFLIVFFFFQIFSLSFLYANASARILIFS